jgi:hypothetical protein
VEVFLPASTQIVLEIEKCESNETFKNRFLIVNVNAAKENISS